ncbi:MAG: adenine nucleotide alpha hydrolase [Alphaproteobacteria bacterium]
MNEAGTTDAVARLEAILRSLGDVAVATSGGVDSTTLAALAQEALGARATMMHATSPAVPPEATRRVRDLAAARGWRLEVIDAREFEDPRYRANPADRCFWCKTNLYSGIAAATDATIVSGTNADDLADWRPGLKAAEAHRVRHPYVEAGIDKHGVRALARHLGLGDVAEHPAAPSLASRVETGIAIDPADLALVHAAETLLARRLGARTLRCRVRRAGLVVELEPAALDALDDRARDEIAAEIAALPGGARPVSFAPYRMGSAFLRPAQACHVG